MDLRSGSAQLWWYLIGFSFLIVGCQNPLQPDNSGAAYAQNPESAYCGAAQATAYSSTTTTVSGTATFAYRPLQTASNCGLCGNPVSLGTTHAEVHILDSAGNIIQCGETDALGAFSLVIPRTEGSYKVQVLSRSLTSNVKASVLKDIYAATPYSVETAFNISAAQSTVSGLSVFASARANDDSNVPGGAFNILADIFWANEFLRNNGGNSSFVADKVSIFWKAGFNPYSYFNSPSVLASFYVSSEDRLYILGGKNDDVKATDTDHFDDSVILHEYGHFLEAHYGHSDTPGGSHNGNFIIDPRLAWSEGWSNYFQGAVLNNIVYANAYTGPKKGSSGFTSYVDTLGFANDSVEGSGSSYGIQITRSLSEPNSAAVYDKSATNEGVFREFSISRTLFKAMTTNPGGLLFASIWEAFKEMRNSHSPAYKFVNFGLYNSILQTVLTANSQPQTVWNNALTDENQVKNTNLYGRNLGTAEPSGSPASCTEITMAPVQDGVYGYDHSNQLMSNDFFTFYHDGTSKQMGLKSRSTGNVIDMNLYLYADGYNYSEEIQEAQAGFSNTTLLRKSTAVNTSASSETEVIDLTGLPAGYYMVNVKASTLNKTTFYLSGGTANYYLYFGNSSTVTTCLIPN
jgi:hypothetical protein